jgi:hypothetical protein
MDFGISRKAEIYKNFEKFCFTKYFACKNIGISNIFTKILTKIFVFLIIFTIFRKNLEFLRLYTFSNIVMSWLFFPGYLSGRLVHSYLSLLSCQSCPAPDVLSKISCSDQSVLCRPSCPGYPVLVVLSELSCLRCHVPDVLSQLAWLFYPSCPVLAGCPVLDILSQPPWLFHPGSPVLAVLSLLSYSGRSACFLSCTTTSVFLTFLS